MSEEEVTPHDPYADWRDRIARVKQVDGAERKRLEREQISAELLVDIAESLRTLAYVAAAGGNPQVAVLADDTQHDGSGRDEPAFAQEEADDLQVGDWVRHDVDKGLSGEILAIGFSEGEEIATIDWVEKEGQSKIFSRFLIRIEKPVPVEDDETPDPEDHVEEIDADFEGDAHPAAEAAVEALAKAEKKAAKKKGKKE